MHDAAARRYGVQFHPECSLPGTAAAEVVPRFLACAAAARLTVPRARGLPAVRVSPDEWARVVGHVANTHVHGAVRTTGLPRDVVTAIWATFRAKVGAPARLV